MLLPLLKKANPNSEDLANYRSVSNLTFVSKLILKAVFNKLNGYNLTDNDLHVTFKSAYKVFHSTETSLLKVHNDIVLALDKNPILKHMAKGHFLHVHLDCGTIFP